MLADNMDLTHLAKPNRSAKLRTLFLLATAFAGLYGPSIVRADIYDQSGNDIQPGFNAAPFSDLSFLDLTNASLSFANLYSANLNNSTLISANLTSANLISANLSAATFNNATLTAGANLTNAQIASANFSYGTSQGLSQDMFASTKSYSMKDLIGVGIGSNNMSGWDLSHQNLAAANLSVGIYSVPIDPESVLQFTDFTQTNLASAFASNSNFGNATLTGATFHQANLATVNFSSGTFTGADFTNANLNAATLTNSWFGTIATFGTQTIAGGTISNAANLTNATVTFANFSSTVSRTAGDKGFRNQLLYETISYQNHDLRGINLSSDDLTVGGTTTSGSLALGAATWDFTSQNLTSANFSSATLAINNATLSANVNALFTGANLTSANFSNATLGAGTFFTDFTNATIASANFSSTTAKGFTQNQLASTASYKNFDLRGVNLSSNTMPNWDFSSQNISSANFSGASLSSATQSSNFTGATINFANFSSPTARSLTLAQLEQTASWNNKDLRGINLSGNNLTATTSGSLTTNIGWDFSNQNVSSANFSSATLSVPSVATTNFSGATVAFANFSGTTAKGFTHDMLQSTVSYQIFDLRGINLSSNNVSVSGTWNFANQNLTGASFSSSNASTTSFAGATLNLASLNSATLTGATFGGSSMVSANLSSSTLAYSDFTGATLTSANFSSAKLMNANFHSADLTGANFNGATFGVNSDGSDAASFSLATIKGATLSFATLRGFSQQMLYATDSYQNAQDLTGLNLSSDDVSGWAFGDNTTHKMMNLSSVSFASSTLSGVNGAAQFTNTTIAFANFSLTTGLHGLTESQLADSKSWINHDLRGINFTFDDLSSGSPWDFTGQNLASANFSNATLSIPSVGTTNFTGAFVNGANFTATTGKGFTFAQLQSTQSYVNQDLSGINLSFDNLAPLDPNTQAPLAAWDLSNQKLVGAIFDSSVLSNFDSLGNLVHSVNFSGANIYGASFNSTTANGFTFAMLQSTQSYINHNLGAIGLGSDNLAVYNTGTSTVGWDLSGQNLVGANFANATLSIVNVGTANFANANIAGANFAHTTPFGFTLAQLYSTTSYASLTLGSINLSQNNLTGANFAGQLMPSANFSLSLLTSANFNDALLQNVNFTNAGLILASFGRADLRGASGFTGVNLSTTNTILPDGKIRGLDLTDGGGHTLVVRDYNGATPIPIHVTNYATFDSSSTLQVLLKDGTWGSTISFDPGLEPVTLGGATLSLGLDTGANISDIVSYAGHGSLSSHIRPMQLFSWTATPTGTFNVVTDPHYKWDLTDLYAGGTVAVDGLYGDLNYDGVVDVRDLYLLAQHWQQSTPNWWDGDLNGDGVVNIQDLQLLSNDWGYGVASAASAAGAPALSPLLTSLGLPQVTVPEPILVGPLMMIGAMALASRRRRSR